ncbi:MAG: 5'-nucleotidase C-terminal domain-containing protein [Pseudomonadota bacterium]
MLKQLKTLALAATLAMTSISTALAADFDLTLLLANDTDQMNKKDRGGIARLNAVVRAERAKGGNVLYLHAGDIISPSLLSGFDKGAHMIELMNLMPADILVPGNHEFDFGKAVFFERMKEIKGAKLLAANLRKADGSPVEGIEDTSLLSYGDAADPLNSFKVGVVGLTADDAPVKSSTEDLQIAAAPAVATAKAKELREAGADIVIALAHTNRGVDRELFASGAFDIILTGDDHDLMLFYDGRKMMAESSEQANYVTAIDLKVSVGERRGKRRVRWHPTFRLMDTASVTPDPETMKLVEGFEATLSKELDVTIGSTNTELDTRKASVRTGETAIGNLITDAMRQAVGADVAITNGGGIRGNKQYAAGTELSRRDILTELPFGNVTMMLEVDAATLKAALENGVSQVENSAGRFPHVSGMTYAYDASKPAGSRITEIMIGGKPIDEGATYKLATNDYMAGGGDGYSVLRKGKVLLNKFDGKLMANDVMAYIRAAGTVEAKVEGRIKTN